MITADVESTQAISGLSGGKRNRGYSFQLLVIDQNPGILHTSGCDHENVGEYGSDPTVKRI